MFGLSHNVRRTLFLEGKKLLKLLNSKWQNTKEALLLPHVLLVKKRIVLVCILTVLMVGELFLPVRGWTQSIADTGLFYFTGSHNPLRTPIFREFMRGEGLRAGPVQLHPFLGIAESYSDNVFRTNSNRRSDFLTTIAPGIQAYLPFGGGKHSLVIDYRAGQILYKEFTENNALAQDAQGHVNFTFPVGLVIDLQGGHIEGFDPRGSAVDIQQQDITKWNINSFLGQAEYSGTRAGLRLRSRFDDWHFKNNNQAPRRDRITLRGDVTVFGNVTPSLSALLGAQIAKTNFDQNTQVDNFSYGAFTGFRLAPGRLLTGELRVGYTVLNFDQAFEPDPSDVSNLTSSRGSQKLLTIDGNLYWNPTSRSSIVTTLSRRIRNSAVFNTGTFIITGVNISGSHALTARTALRGSFSFLNIDFDSGRNDNRLNWRMGVQYRTLRWLGFRLDYLFQNRFSNQENFDFYSNSVMFSIEAFL